MRDRKTLIKTQQLRVPGKKRWLSAQNLLSFLLKISIMRREEQNLH